MLVPFRAARCRSVPVIRAGSGVAYGARTRNLRSHNVKVEHEGPPWRVPRVNLERYVDDLVTAPSPRVEKVPAVNGWELRLMGDQRTYTRANGTKFTRTVSWHLGSPEQARHYGNFL